MSLSRKECNELLKLLNSRQYGKTEIYNKIREEIINNIHIESFEETYERIINNSNKKRKYNLNTGKYNDEYKYNLPHIVTIYTGIMNKKGLENRKELLYKIANIKYSDLVDNYFNKFL